MAKQNNVKAQEGTDEGGSYMKIPPEGTKARNRRYYPYTRDPLKAGEKLKNPLEPTAEVLSQGEKYYKMYCIYCHGSKGDSGEGASVAPKMAIKPASLLTKKAKDYRDGRIYHIIYEGQGLMGAYNLQLESKEQVILSHHVQDKHEYKGSDSIWSVVHYVRQLQRTPEKGASEKGTSKDTKTHQKMTVQKKITQNNETSSQAPTSENKSKPITNSETTDEPDSQTKTTESDSQNKTEERNSKQMTDSKSPKFKVDETSQADKSGETNSKQAM